MVVDVYYSPSDSHRAMQQLCLYLRMNKTSCLHIICKETLEMQCTVPPNTPCSPCSATFVIRAGIQLQPPLPHLLSHTKKAWHCCSRISSQDWCQMAVSGVQLPSALCWHVVRLCCDGNLRTCIHCQLRHPVFANLLTHSASDVMFIVFIGPQN